MPLTCYCDDNGDYEWYYVPPYDYCETPNAGNRKRCKSCRKLIGHGALAAKWERVKYDYDENEIIISPWWHCEQCADLYYSLYELGFTCIAPDENVRELVKLYSETHKRN